MKYENYSEYAFNKELFEPIKNYNDFVKPDGGFWACLYRHKQSLWLEFSKDLKLSKRYKYRNIFELKQDSKILNISGLKDLEIIMEYYAQPLNERYKDRELYKHYTYLDFEKLSKDYDAIYVEDSELLYLNWFNSYSLYSWDVESLLVLNPDCIINVVSKYLKEK